MPASSAPMPWSASTSTRRRKLYVQLRGACGTCPSSTATMQFGVKNLLNEEFPAMVHLYDITSGSPVIVEDPSMA